VAQGIQELERMGQTVCFTDFYPFLKSRYYDVRKAARLAITKLAKNPLHFLDQVNEELSEWEQMSLNVRLKKRGKEQLPDFSIYFTHPQPSVAAFCIKMAAQFNYFEHIPKHTQLLFQTKGELQVTVLEALSRLEAFQALAHVENLIEQTDDGAVVIACLKFIGKIGDEGSHYLVKKYMERPEADVRVAAVAAAIRLNVEPDHLDEDLKQIFGHHQNELIS